MTEPVEGFSHREIDPDFKEWLETMARNSSAAGEPGISEFLRLAGVNELEEATLTDLAAYAFAHEKQDEGGEVSLEGWTAMLLLGFEIGYRHAMRHDPKLGDV